MRPISIRVQRFRGWNEGVEIDLGRPLTMLVGDNGDGKSSTLDAVGWCLFGGQVEVKASEIDERKDWQVRFRHECAGPTEVELRLRSDAVGDVRIRRRRAEGASAKADELRVEVGAARPDDAQGERVGGADSGSSELLEGDRAGAWLESNLPDWPTFRRAHMQHQAAVRARLVNSADRTAVLGLLLGLDDDSWLQNGLDSRSVSGAKLIARVDEEVADLEGALDQEFARHGKEVRELETRLADGGLSLDRIGPASIDEIGVRMLEGARSLAAGLAIDVEIPDLEAEHVAPLPDLLAWADAWPSRVRKACEAIDAETRARREHKRSLEEALAAADRGATGVREAEAALREHLAVHGEVDEQAARVAEREVIARRAQERLEQADRLSDLLGRARTIVTGRAGQGQRPLAGVSRAHAGETAPRDARPAAGGSESDADLCPVCDQPHRDLLGHIEAAMAHHDSDARAALDEALRRARRELDQAEALLQQARLLSERAQRAQDEAGEQRTALAALVRDEDDGAAEAHDPRAEARTRIEQLEASIGGYEEALNAREEALRRHSEQGDRLRLLSSWQEARRRAMERVDVSELAQWRELQAAIDEAAGWAADQEALGHLVRDAQVQRAKERAEEVNGRLGTYLQAILGDPSAHDIRVHVHQTAKNIEYQLRDGSGAQFVAVSNQARLNAVSLALLFAQAEEQARQGRLAWAIIDDPVQSLDEHHQRGLATALELLCAHCPVLVSATWSDPLVERIRSHVACERQIVTLRKHPERECVILEERETL